MRIGIVCHNYLPHPGGVEIVVNNLGRSFAAAHEVTVVSTSSGSAHSGIRIEDGMVVHRLPAIHWTEKWGVPYPVPKGPGLLAAVRVLADVDVIHLHGALYATSALGVAVSTLARVPLVLTEHVGFVAYSSRALEKIELAAWTLVGDRVCHAASAITCYSERVARWMRMRYSGKEISLIGNGVDGDRFRPLGDASKLQMRAELGLPVDETLALFVGRDVAKKNLAAVLAIPRETFSLVVCGDVRAIAEDRVIDLGLLSHAEMARVYRCADLLVHAATGEGFPLTVQEAMSSGLPVVLLWDEGYGAMVAREVVDACDSLDELSSAVRRLSQDAHARAEVGERGRSWAEARWSWAVAASSYLALFAKVVNSCESTSPEKT